MFKIIVFSLCYLFCHILLHVYYMKQQFDFFYKLGIKVKFLAQNIKTVHNYCFYYNTFCRSQYILLYGPKVEQLTHYD